MTHPVIMRSLHHTEEYCTCIHEGWNFSWFPFHYAQLRVTRLYISWWLCRYFQGTIHKLSTICIKNKKFTNDYINLFWPLLTPMCTCHTQMDTVSCDHVYTWSQFRVHLCVCMCVPPSVHWLTTMKKVIMQVAVSTTRSAYDGRVRSKAFINLVTSY